MATSETDQSPQLYSVTYDLESGDPPTMNPSSPTLCSLVLRYVLKILHWVVSLGLLLWMDLFWKDVFGFGFSELLGQLLGMACLIILLYIIYSVSPSAASAFVSLFEPAVMFIHKWLPLFYAPYLVMLPLSIKDIPPSSSSIKLYFIIVGGCLGTLCAIGYATILARKYVVTSLADFDNMEMPSTISAEPIGRPSSKFSSIGVWAWTGIFLISFVVSLFYPTALGTKARTCFPFLLASAVLGHMVGSSLPSKERKVFNPVIFCAASIILTAYAFGCFTNSGLDPVLGYFVTKSSSNPGAGDILMACLGCVILSFPFCISQKKLLERHGAEILTSVIISPILLMTSTFLLGALLTLEPSLADSILPQCITVVLALILVSLFKGANSSVATASVVVCGVIGANYVQSSSSSSFPPVTPGNAPTASPLGIAMPPLSAKEPKALTVIAHALKSLLFLGEKVNGVFG